MPDGLGVEQFGGDRVSMTEALQTEAMQKYVEQKFGGVMLDGKEVPPDFTRITVGFGDIFKDEEYQFKRLLKAGMPGDLLRWQLKIDGAGVGKPDLMFSFAGVFNPPTGPPRPDAQSPLAFTPNIYTTINGRLVQIKTLAFVWEMMAYVKGTQAAVRQTYDPEGKEERSSTDKYSLTMQNLASNATASKERAKLMHKLETGYSLIGGLWEGIRKRDYQTRTDEISVENFRAWVLKTARELAREGVELSIGELARRGGMHRNTISKYLKRDRTLLANARDEWQKTPRTDPQAEGS